MPSASLRASRTTPTISLSGARAAYVGPGLDLAPHRNAVATVALALQTPFQLELLEDRSGGVASALFAVIPPGALHHLRATGDMAFIYLDALSDDFRNLRSGDLARGHARICAAPMSGDVDDLCAAIGVPRRPVADARVAGAVRQIDVRPQDFTNVDDAARLVGVSASRFQTLFRQSVGLSFRRYRLWRRMAIVIRAMSAGRSLTYAAHDAGFASSAHLSTAFREMFGLTPSSLAALGAGFSIRSEAETLGPA
jgi:AraC-like DNA-binding protein